MVRLGRIEGEEGEQRKGETTKNGNADSQSMSDGKQSLGLELFSDGLLDLGVGLSE